MKIRFRNKKQLFTAMIIASFVIAAGVYFYFSSQFYPFNILVLKKDQDPTRTHFKILRDLDHDGYAEGIMITNPSNGTSPNNINNIQVLNENIIAEEQYNLGKYHSHETSLFCTDVNNDNYDDLIYFYQGADSIFLSVIDHKNRKFIVKKKLLYTKPKEARKGFDWIPIVKCVDADTDKGTKYLYFIISTGHPIFPRGIYKLNLTDFEIERRFEAGANILHTISLCDVDGDGKKEILAASATTNNTPNLPYKLKYDDTASHLFLFDSNLNILRHKTYYTGYGGAYFCLLNEGKGKKILISFRNINAGNKFTLQVLNKDFKILNEKITPFEQAFFPSIVNDKIVLPTPKGIAVFKHNLREFYNIDYGLRNYTTIFKVNINGNKYRLIVDDAKSILMDMNMNIVAAKDIQINGINSIQPNPNSFKLKSYPGKQLVLVRGLEEELWLSFEKNVYYSYLPLLFPSVFLVSFLFLFTTRKIYISLFKYHSIFKHVIPQSENGIIILNEFNQIDFMNDTAKKLLNINDGVLNNKNIKEAGIDSELKEFILGSIEENKISENVITLVSGKDRSKINVVVFPLLSKFNSTIGHLVVFNNLTHHLLRERTDLLSHSIQKVAHEIKTPLSSILLNLDSMEEKADNPSKEKIKNDLDVVRKEISRIKRFTNNFLKFANLQKPNFQFVRAESIIFNSLLKFESYLKRGVDIKKNIEEGIIIWADEYQLEEAMQVLIENAIDAIKGKGEIEIALYRNNGKAVFEIKDNGPGIPERIRKTLFDPYVTTKPEGTGMGLSIAKKILEDHESELRFNSRVGETVFSFEIKTKETVTNGT